MGKIKGKKNRGAVAVAKYDSDDERSYAKEAAPDKDGDDYFYDDVDQFHMDREKIMLDKGASLEPAVSSDEENEVLGFDDDDDDDEAIEKYEQQLQKFRSRGFKDELASDLEDEEGDGLPDDRAWGQTRKKFYDADVDDDHRIDSGSEADAALLEEREALAIQKRMAEQLDDQDVGLDLFKAKTKETVKEDETKIEKDLSKLSRKEKLQILKNKSPELLDLIADYKLKMTELKERLMPIQKLIKDGTLPQSNATDFVSTKVQLYMNYCVNISFYLMLKSKHTPVENHPVIKRLVQFRNLITELGKVDDKVGPKIDNLLEKIRNGEKIVAASSVPHVDREASLKRRALLKAMKSKEEAQQKRKLSAMLDDSESEGEDMGESKPEGGRAWGRKKQAVDGTYETKDEKAALEYYQMMKGGRKTTEEAEMGALADDNEDDDEAMVDEEESGEEEGDERRAIDYKIEKNKGLTPHRKKENRNPRVKHRMKYRKAKIRRKGMIRPVRTETRRYDGEISGIRAGVKRGIKLK